MNTGTRYNLTLYLNKGLDLMIDLSISGPLKSFMMLLVPASPHRLLKSHYNDVRMGTIASQITSLTIVYSTVYSDADQRKHQSSASLAFVWGIHRDRWIPRTNGQLRGKCFHLMTSSWNEFSLKHLECYISEALLLKEWNMSASEYNAVRINW